VCLGQPSSQLLPWTADGMNRCCIRTALIAAAAYSTLMAQPGIAADTQPYGQTGHWILLKDWTFGRSKPDATIRSKADLDREFYYRYIYDGGRLDSLPTYWSIHRDYPENDPRSLHVFTGDGLILKGRVPPGGGLRPGGIESGMLRSKFAVEPGMYVEMRARLPRGVGAWPAFWLNPGVEYSSDSFSATPWPPEIDIFEFFNWQNHPDTTTLESNVQVDGHPERFGYPRDEFTLFINHKYTPGIDFSAGFHVFALDWRADNPVWLLDGRKIKQTHYEWRAPPAHLLVTNQLGIALPRADMSGMTADERNWDFVIDYIRIWRRSPLRSVTSSSGRRRRDSRSETAHRATIARRRHPSPITRRGCRRFDRTA
jgi:glycosyl hydrolase family 16